MDHDSDEDVNIIRRRTMTVMRMLIEYLKDDCNFTLFLNFIPNRFCFKPEPHELVWKSVTAILHRISVNIFLIFSCSQNLEPYFQIYHITDPTIYFWPGDVLACPIIYQFVHRSANVPQTSLILHKS